MKIAAKWDEKYKLPEQPKIDYAYERAVAFLQDAIREAIYEDTMSRINMTYALGGSDKDVKFESRIWALYTKVDTEESEK